MESIKTSLHCLLRAACFWACRACMLPVPCDEAAASPRERRGWEEGKEPGRKKCVRSRSFLQWAEKKWVSSAAWAGWAVSRHVKPPVVIFAQDFIRRRDSCTLSQLFPQGHLRLLPCYFRTPLVQRSRRLSPPEGTASALSRVRCLRPPRRCTLGHNAERAALPAAGAMTTQPL